MDMDEKTSRLCIHVSIGNQSKSTKSEAMEQAPVMLKGDPATEGVYYHRPPVLVDLFYLISL